MYSSRTSPPLYGSRPVPIDTARGRSLREIHGDGGARGDVIRRPRLTDQAVADRLALAHWPPGHQIVICSLAGGIGRSTLAGLMATVLVELPYAHLHRPVAVVEALPRTMTVTPRRWGVDQSELTPPLDDAVGCTPSGAWVFQGASYTSRSNAFSVLVVDAPVGLPSDLTTLVEDSSASVLLITRPDRVSLSDAAEALVWMNKCSPVTRNRVSVVINNGVGEADRSARAAATALGIRCAAIHRLGREATLAPGVVLPSGRAVPVRLRRTVARICLAVWSSIPVHQYRPPPEEHR